MSLSDLSIKRPVLATSLSLLILLAGAGFVLPATFGLIPIGGNDITLHAVLGIVLTMVGAMSETEESPLTA